MKEDFDKKLIEARTVEDFDRDWATFQQTYARYDNEIKYLKDELISCRHRWARPLTRETLTLTYKATSVVEGTNSVIGSWLAPSFSLTVRWRDG